MWKWNSQRIEAQNAGITRVPTWIRDAAGKPIPWPLTPPAVTTTKRSQAASGASSRSRSSSALSASGGLQSSSTAAARKVRSGSAAARSSTPFLSMMTSHAETEMKRSFALEPDGGPRAAGTALAAGRLQGRRRHLGAESRLAGGCRLQDGAVGLHGAIYQPAQRSRRPTPLARRSLGRRGSWPEPWREPRARRGRSGGEVALGFAAVERQRRTSAAEVCCIAATRGTPGQSG